MHMKKGLERGSSKNALDQELVDIQKEIVRQFSKGPNRAIARSLAIIYAEAQRDLITRSGKPAEAVEWISAISDAEDGNIGLLKNLINERASWILVGSEFSNARYTFEEQAKSLDNLADSLY